MNCKRAGFVVMRHNNVRDFSANLLKATQNDAEIEPALQKIDNEKIDSVQGMKQGQIYEVWQQGQNAFFDIGLTNVNANSQKNQSVETILRKHEKEKKTS